MLQKYGIISIDSSRDIKRLLDQNNFEENIDYNIGKVAGIRKNYQKYIQTLVHLH